MITWNQAVEIIETRELARLIRSPEQIEQYRKAKAEFEKSHGGTAEFVISERLQWVGDKLKSSGAPLLQNQDDFKVLPNDFSYAFENGIRHFLVWLKSPIPCNADEFPTLEATQTIERFLDTYFAERCGIPRKNIAWFKNTNALQSIPSVSHFHVLVRNCTKEIEQKILTKPE